MSHGDFLIKIEHWTKVKLTNSPAEQTAVIALINFQKKSNEKENVFCL